MEEALGRSARDVAVHLLPLFLDPPSFFALSRTCKIFLGVYREILNHNKRSDIKILDIDGGEFRQIESRFHLEALCARHGHFELAAIASTLPVDSPYDIDSNVSEIIRQAITNGQFKFLKASGEILGNAGLSAIDQGGFGRHKAHFQIPQEFFGSWVCSFRLIPTLAYALIHKLDDEIEPLMRSICDVHPASSNPAATASIEGIQMAAVILGHFGTFANVVKFRDIIKSDKMELVNFRRGAGFYYTVQEILLMATAHARSGRFDKAMIEFCYNSLLSEKEKVAEYQNALAAFSRFDILKYLDDNYSSESSYPFGVIRFAAVLVAAAERGTKDFLLNFLAVANPCEILISPPYDRNEKADIVFAALFGGDSFEQSEFPTITSQLRDSNPLVPIRFDSVRIEMIEFLFPLLKITKNDIELLLTLFKTKWRPYKTFMTVPYLEYLSNRWGLSDALLGSFLKPSELDRFPPSIPVLKYLFRTDKPSLKDLGAITSSTFFHEMLVPRSDSPAVEFLESLITRLQPSLVDYRYISKCLDQKITKARDVIMQRRSERFFWEGELRLFQLYECEKGDLRFESELLRRRCYRDLSIRRAWLDSKVAASDGKPHKKENETHSNESKSFVEFLWPILPF